MSEPIKPDLFEARPVHHGIDPLTAGYSLVNPTNSEDETHYIITERPKYVRRPRNVVPQQVAGGAWAPVAQPHQVPNADASEQDEVAKGRVEPAAEPIKKPKSK